MEQYIEPIDQLLKNGTLRRQNGTLQLAIPLAGIAPAAAGYYDSLDKWSNTWSAEGWAFDPETRRPCIYAFPVQGHEVASDVVFQKVIRHDVNHHLGVDDLITGFTVSFRPRPGGAPVELIAVLPSGELIRLPGPGRESAEQTDTTLSEAADVQPEWRRLCSSPLYAFPQDSVFHGIHTFEARFNPRQTAGVTEQFLADAADYHRKYTDHAHWTYLLGKALSRTPIDVDGHPQLSILDIGCGSGNTVIPLLKILPQSRIVASDISPQLLALLRDQVGDAERRRLLLMAMDASQRHFAGGTFDLTIGAAILHHIINPSDTIGACHHFLKPGGHAIFFEPFEEGYLLLRLLYEQLLDHASQLKLSSDVARALQIIIRDCDLRKGRDKSAEIYSLLDDKWLFTRSYFEQQKARYGFSGLQMYELYPSQNMLSAQFKTHMRLLLSAGQESVNPEVLEYIHAFEKKISPALYDELLMEACVIFTK